MIGRFLPWHWCRIILRRSVIVVNLLQLDIVFNLLLELVVAEAGHVGLPLIVDMKLLAGQEMHI